jgi:hypothetical protein
MTKVPQYGDEVLDEAIVTLFLIAKKAHVKSLSIMEIDGHAFMAALGVVQSYRREVRRECARLIRRVNPNLEIGL